MTTRAPRPGEIDGVDFRFVDEASFRAMLGRGEFAEWATVHGHLYGTPARALEEALAGGGDVLLDIDTQGAAQVRARYPEAVLIFLVAPSLRDLEQRLRERRSDNEQEIARRLTLSEHIVHRHVANILVKLRLSSRAAAAAYAAKRGLTK